MGIPATKPDSIEAPKVDFEKRYKDTQGAYTKSQQELKVLKAKLQAMEKLTTPQVNIPPEMKAELDELKYSNPDEWRAKINVLEQKAKDTLKEEVETEASKVIVEDTLVTRQKQLEEFNRSHPELKLTDDVIKYDIPPRITTQLEQGKITFEQFLEQASNFLSAPKVIGDGNTVTNQPDLTTVGGDSTPTKASTDKDIVTSYKDEIY